MRKRTFSLENPRLSRFERHLFSSLCIIYTITSSDVILFILELKMIHQKERVMDNIFRRITSAVNKSSLHQ